VTQSPAGQVTVTSVVKDLAVGSRLDLTAGPMMRLPNGEQLHLFLVRPLGARRLGDPRHDG
jgi:urease beta subunit